MFAPELAMDTIPKNIQKRNEMNKPLELRKLFWKYKGLFVNDITVMVGLLNLDPGNF